MTCCSRSGSPTTRAAAGSSRAVSAIRFGVCRGSDGVERGVDQRRHVERPDLEVELAGDDARAVEDVLDEPDLGAWRCARWCRRRAGTRSGRAAPDCSMRAQPRIALSGVRSSCEAVDRKSSLARLASSAASRAVRSLSSSRARSSAARREASMSVLVPNHRTICRSHLGAGLRASDASETARRRRAAATPSRTARPSRATSASGPTLPRDGRRRAPPPSPSPASRRTSCPCIRTNAGCTNRCSRQGARSRPAAEWSPPELESWLRSFAAVLPAPGSAVWPRTSSVTSRARTMAASWPTARPGTGCR